MSPIKNRGRIQNNTSACHSSENASVPPMVLPVSFEAISQFPSTRPSNSQIQPRSDHHPQEGEISLERGPPAGGEPMWSIPCAVRTAFLRGVLHKPSPLCTGHPVPLPVFLNKWALTEVETSGISVEGARWERNDIAEPTCTQAPNSDQTAQRATPDPSPIAKAI